MKWSVNRLLGSALLVVGMTGCKSSHYSSFLPEQKTPYDGSARIVGLPLLGNGVEVTASGQNRMEAQIDKSLSGLWKTRYMPIAQVRQEQGVLAESWTNQMTCNYDLSVWLQGHPSLCRNIMQISGCRYAIVPTLGSSSKHKATTLIEIYVIPVFIVIICGAIPVAHWEYPSGKSTFFSMVLVDLDQEAIVAEETIGIKKELDQASLSIPGALMKEMKRIDLQLAKKSGVK